MKKGVLEKFHSFLLEGNWSPTRLQKEYRRKNSKYSTQLISSIANICTIQGVRHSAPSKNFRE